MKLAFDQIGSIAILEPPREMEINEKEAAGEILANNKHIRSVYLKTGGRQGEYRVSRLKYIAGKKTTITTYRESDCAFELDIAKVYFSPRLAFERTRIANQVKTGEKVLALFAGVGPFPIVIAKKLKRKGENAEIIANELNPTAVKYLKRNIEINKANEMVQVQKGDAKKLLKEKKKGGDRIIMPLPHTAHKFLSQVIDAAARDCIVHYYGFGTHRTKGGRKTNPFKKLEGKIKLECRKKKRKCKIIFERIVRPYSPFQVQVVIDFKVR